MRIIQRAILQVVNDELSRCGGYRLIEGRRYVDTCQIESLLSNQQIQAAYPKTIRDEIMELVGRDMLRPCPAGLDAHSLTSSGFDALAGADTDIKPKLKRARTPSASRRLTATAKAEAAKAAIDRYFGGCWTGHYRDLVSSLRQKAGIEVSTAWITRNLKGTRYLSGGDPHRAAPGRGEHEAVAADDGPDDLHTLDAYTMPD